MKSIKAIIFDLDGTLLDTLEDLADSMNRVLGDNGFPQHQVDRYRYFVGDGIDLLISRALPDHARSPELTKRLVHEMTQVYGVHWRDKTRPYPGVDDMLVTLADRELSLNILSNKPDAMTQRIVAAFFPGHRFDHVVGARPDVPKKPDPAGALDIADKLGISGHHILYLGDTATDMQTAVSAGMLPLGALWGFRTTDELQRAGASALLARPEEIILHL
ncbi:MAG: HAD family hydrolase [Thermodesulfobacteriota bacterium]